MLQSGGKFCSNRNVLFISTWANYSSTGFLTCRFGMIIPNKISPVVVHFEKRVANTCINYDQDDVMLKNVLRQPPTRNAPHNRANKT